MMASRSSGAYRFGTSPALRMLLMSSSMTSFTICTSLFKNSTYIVAVIGQIKQNTATNRQALGVSSPLGPPDPRTPGNHSRPLSSAVRPTTCTEYCTLATFKRRWTRSAKCPHRLKDLLTECGTKRKLSNVRAGGGKQTNDSNRHKAKKAIRGTEGRGDRGVGSSSYRRRNANS